MRTVTGIEYGWTRAGSGLDLAGGWIFFEKMKPKMNHASLTANRVSWKL